MTHNTIRRWDVIFSLHVFNLSHLKEEKITILGPWAKDFSSVYLLFLSISDKINMRLIVHACVCRKN